MFKLTKTIAKKKAYHAFQLFLRTLWTQSGTIACYTCGKVCTFKQIQAGHWYTGHGNATYINEDYVRPQCVQCNIMMGGRQGEFRDKIRKELGNKVTDALLLAAKESPTITVSDYQELEAWYKQQLQDLVDKRLVK
jgi:hypothetical protein